MVMDFSKLSTTTSKTVFQGVSGVRPLSVGTSGGNTPSKTRCSEVFSEPSRHAQKHQLHVEKPRVFSGMPRDYNGLTPKTPKTHICDQLAPEDLTSLLNWLQSIGESNPLVKQEVIERCRSDPSALAYYLSRASESNKNMNDIRTDKYTEHDSDF